MADMPLNNLLFCRVKSVRSLLSCLICHLCIWNDIICAWWWGPQHRQSIWQCWKLAHHQRMAGRGSSSARFWWPPSLESMWFVHPVLISILLPCLWLRCYTHWDLLPGDICRHQELMFLSFLKVKKAWKYLCTEKKHYWSFQGIREASLPSPTWLSWNVMTLLSSVPLFLLDLIPPLTFPISVWRTF